MGRLRFAYQTLCWLTYGERLYEVDECIREIHEAGFRSVEFAQQLQHFERRPGFRGLMKELGMEMASLSSGISYDPGDPLTVTMRRADFAAEFGVKALMLCGGGGADWRLKADEQYDSLARNLDRLAEYMEQYGMTPSFHPHMGTIVETREDTERLLERSKKMTLCLDASHLAVVGADPVQFYRDFRERVSLVHIKDWKWAPHTERSQQKGRFVELGAGDLKMIDDFLRVLAEGDYGGWVCVELDESTSTPLDSAKINAEYLRRHGFM